MQLSHAIWENLRGSDYFLVRKYRVTLGWVGPSWVFSKYNIPEVEIKDYMENLKIKLVTRGGSIVQDSVSTEYSFTVLKRLILRTLAKYEFEVVVRMEGRSPSASQFYSRANRGADYAVFYASEFHKSAVGGAARVVADCKFEGFLDASLELLSLCGLS